MLKRNRGRTGGPSRTRNWRSAKHELPTETVIKFWRTNLEGRAW